MYAITICTMNRQAVLQRTLDAILATTRQEGETEGVEILVVDNNSEDSTPDLLREYERQGKLKAWCLPSNLGTEMGRNVFWAETGGKDTLRMDDKVMPLYPGWLRSLKVLADRNHALMAVPYDPAVLGLWRLAPIVPAMTWPHEQGVGGPLIFIPAEVRDQLGGCDEIPGMVYGWGDILYIERAKLLGWKFGFSLRSPVEFLASANPARRAGAMEYHGLYMERLREYREAERDLYIDPLSTEGYRIGQEAVLCSV